MANRSSRSERSCRRRALSPSSLPDGTAKAFAHSPAQLDGVTIEPFALAREDGEADLYWPVYNGMPMHALASLDRGEAENWLGPESIYGFDPDLQSMDRERVVMRRLDGLELDPDMIKIDVQGTEPDVIEGVSRRFGERGLRSWPRPSRPVGRPWSCSSRSATASTHSARAPSSPGRIPRRQITF